jgi:hypothetical protein
MRLAKAQLPPSLVLKKLNQKCRIIRTKDKEDSGGGDGAFIFLNIHFHDVAATNASLAGSGGESTGAAAACIPALELPAAFKVATFTVLKDKATAAQFPVTNMDLWLDCGGGLAAEKKLIHLDRKPRAVRVAVKFKTEEEAVAASGRRREAAEQLLWVNQWYHSRIEILTLFFRPLPPRYSGKHSAEFQTFFYRHNVFNMKQFFALFVRQRQNKMPSFD